MSKAVPVALIGMLLVRIAFFQSLVLYVTVTSSIKDALVPIVLAVAGVVLIVVACRLARGHFAAFAAVTTLFAVAHEAAAILGLVPYYYPPVIW